jgi:hypothetical protein
MKKTLRADQFTWPVGCVQGDAGLRTVRVHVCMSYVFICVYLYVCVYVSHKSHMHQLLRRRPEQYLARLLLYKEPPCQNKEYQNILQEVQ